MRSRLTIARSVALSLCPLHNVHVNNIVIDGDTMPRPKKAEGDKRESRLTVYLTDEERDTLATVADRAGRAMTQSLVMAVKEWVQCLVDPPETLKRARYEKVMEQQSEMLRGYICRNGHPFSVEWIHPSCARFCPACGAERASNGVGRQHRTRAITCR